MPWDGAAWDADLLSWYRKLAEIRRGSAAVRRGAYAAILCDGDCFAFVRQYGGEAVYVLFNRGSKPCRLALPVSLNGVYVDLLDGGAYTAENGTVLVDASGASVKILTLQGGCL
jgi:glycosidase